MKARRLTAADAVAFRFVRLEALEREPAAYGSTLADWQAMPLAGFVRRIEEGVIFGLWTDKGLEGILAYDRERGGHTRHRATLTAFYVRDALRGSGAADLLLDAAMSRAEADGVLQIELLVADANTRARAFYVGRGFAEVARLPRALRLGDVFEDELLLVRRLHG